MTIKSVRANDREHYNGVMEMTRRNGVRSALVFTGGEPWLRVTIKYGVDLRAVNMNRATQTVLQVFDLLLGTRRLMDQARFLSEY